MYCDLFKISSAPPNLGITRTWICRLIFLRGLFFQAWGFLNEAEISDFGPPQLEVPPGGLVLGIFTSRKNQSTSAGFEATNLESRGEHVTPRPPRPTNWHIKWNPELINSIEVQLIRTDNNYSQCHYYWTYNSKNWHKLRLFYYYFSFLIWTNYVHSWT